MSKPEFESPEEVSRWVREHFVRSFMNEANPIYWPTKNESGIFAITLLCLTFCNAAAGLIEGTPFVDSLHCIQFIQTYLKASPTPSGSRYKSRGAALYTLFRHGLAHLRVPGNLDLEDGRTLGWALGRENDRGEHLELLSSGCYRTRDGKHDGHFRLLVQPDVLYADFLAAFQNIQSQASGNRRLAERIFAAADASAKPRTLSTRPEKREARSLILARLRKAVDHPDPYRPLFATRPR